MHEIAYAKINLALHVRKRREDGYHLLETLFAFAEDGDVLTAEPADDLSLRIDGPFAAGLSTGPNNLVLKATIGLQQLMQTNQGAAIHLDKQLPIAAGIGGGSADAAAALRLLPKLWGLTPDPAALDRLAAGLGADVPACLASQTVRGEGVGEVLTPVAGSDLTGLPLLLVNPQLACPTGPVFKAWDGVDRGPLAVTRPLTAALAGRNDLEEPATQMIPGIAQICAWLSAQKGVRLCRMSGSGATCFAIFDSEDDMQKANAAADPTWWTLATRLR